MSPMNQITATLYVGSLHTLKSPRDLSKAGITHVVSLLREDVPDMSKAGFHHLQIRVDDDDEEDLMQYFEIINTFIAHAHMRSEAVLVHCIAGISRSVTAVAASLCAHQKVTPDNAIAMIKAKREIANPNPSFREQLQIYWAEGCILNNNSVLYRKWIENKVTEGIPLEFKILKVPKFLSIPKFYDVPTDQAKL